RQEGLVYDPGIGHGGLLHHVIAVAIADRVQDLGRKRDRKAGFGLEEGRGAIAEDREKHQRKHGEAEEDRRQAQHLKDAFGAVPCLHPCRLADDRDFRLRRRRLSGRHAGGICGKIAHSYCSRYFRTIQTAITFRSSVMTKSVMPSAKATRVSGLLKSVSPVSWPTILTVIVVMASKGLRLSFAAAPAPITTIIVSPMAREAPIRI